MVTSKTSDGQVSKPLSSSTADKHLICPTCRHAYEHDDGLEATFKEASLDKVKALSLTILRDFQENDGREY